MVFWLSVTVYYIYYRCKIDTKIIDDLQIAIQQDVYRK
jgi:hypothetical protein